MRSLPKYTNINYNNPHFTKQIQFNIFLTTGQNYIATGSLGQTFQSVIDNTFQINNILHLRKHIHGAILESKRIFPKKTLTENGIYHGCKVLLIVGDLGIKST